MREKRGELVEKERGEDVEVMRDEGVKGGRKEGRNGDCETLVSPVTSWLEVAPTDEGRGSSNTSVDSITSRLLKTAGGPSILEELTAEDVTGVTTLPAVVLLNAPTDWTVLLVSVVAVVSNWDCSVVVMFRRRGMSTVWLDITNCTDSDGSGPPGLVAVPSGVSVVREGKSVLG